MKGVWEGGGIIEDRNMDPDERVFEFFLNQLRLRDGVLKDQLEPRAGVAWNEVAAKVGVAIEKGLLREDNKLLSPTELGWRFVNELQAIFLP